MFESVDALLAEHAECERAMADPAVIAAYLGQGTEAEA